MLIYTLLYISFLIPALLEVRKAESKKYIEVYYFLMVIFLVTAGIRDLIGGYDVYIYRSVFLRNTDGIDSSSFEIGFKSLFKVLKLFSDSEYFMFFVISCIITITTFTSLKKYSNYIFLALFIFFCKFYLMSYVYLRQGIAMGIVWYSLKYVYRRDLLRFLIVVLMGFLFHKSALIFILVYFFNNKHKKVKYIITFFVFLLITITPIINPVLIYLSGFDDRYEGYGSSIGQHFNILYMLEAIVCFLVFLFYHKNVVESKKIVLFNGFFFYILLQLLAAKKGIFIRLTWYYLIFYCIILSSFINDFQFSRKIYKPILIIGFSLLFFRLLIVWDNGDFLPYKSIIDNTERKSIWRNLK